MDKITLTPEISNIISKSAFIALVSVSNEGNPHLIVVGKVKEIRDENTLVFGVYKMDQTRKNISETGILQVAVVFNKTGYRFIGKACVEEKEILFSIEKIEALL
jgi:predicted pyridoxine 5'-phosphate oxidase superfamily flavin-nucleotide-binding protein